MACLLKAFIKIAVEEAVKSSVDHPPTFSTIGAALRRNAVLFWL